MDLRRARWNGIDVNTYTGPPTRKRCGHADEGARMMEL